MCPSRFCRIAVFGLVLCSSAFVKAQTTWYVDDNALGDPGPGDPLVSDPAENGTAGHPFDAIQEAIDAAADNDEIVVLDGTYTGSGNKNLDFYGKAITIRSASGDPSTCIIDCDQDGRAFYFHRGETRSAVLKGLTIMDGYVEEEDGACIACIDSSPTIDGCVFSGGETWIGSGGGIYSEDGSPRITGCRFEDCCCSAVDRFGAGGGGVHCTGGTPEIVGSFFYDCWVNAYCIDGGGAIGFYETSIVIRDNEILSCSAHGAGGGILGYDSQVDISHNQIAMCSGFHYGGGASLWDCSGVFANNVLVDNQVPDRMGGGLHVDGGHIEVAFCTIANNRVNGTWSGCGGGICAFSDSEVSIHHCIICWNSALIEGDQIHIDEPATATVRYCDVQDGWPGEGNIDEYPFFVRNPDPGPDEEWGTEDDDLGDLHLRSPSPCIDAGDPAYCPVGQTDIDGEPRAMRYTANRVDMGADELSGDPFAFTADLNCDCVADALDVTAFALALVDEPSYEAMYPYCDRMLADVNNDGLVNGTDIPIFVEVLLDR